MPTLNITSQQMTAYEAARQDCFQQALINHLRENVGGSFAAQSDKELLGFIDKGIKRAKGYGATDNLAFGNFVVMAAMFGENFDTSSDYPWAQETLKSNTTMDGNTRIESLAEQFAFYLSTVKSDQGDNASPAEQDMSENTTGGIT